MVFEWLRLVPNRLSIPICDMSPSQPVTWGFSKMLDNNLVRRAMHKKNITQQKINKEDIDFWKRKFCEGRWYTCWRCSFCVLTSHNTKCSQWQQQVLLIQIFMWVFSCDNCKRSTSITLRDDSVEHSSPMPKFSNDNKCWNWSKTLVNYF